MYSLIVSAVTGQSRARSVIIASFSEIGLRVGPRLKERVGKKPSSPGLRLPEQRLQISSNAISSGI
jgi:hypothetical protein